jgi:hypothetical protein
MNDDVKIWKAFVSLCCMPTNGYLFLEKGKEVLASVKQENLCNQFRNLLCLISTRYE